MGWIEFAKQLGLYSASGIIVFVIVGYFGKLALETFFSHRSTERKNELDQELEIYKHKLSLESDRNRAIIDKDFEDYRNKLEIHKLEGQFQFTKLHEKRGEVVQELFGLLLELHSDAVKLTQPLKFAKVNFDEEENERALNVNNSFNEYNKFLSKNRIYFEKELEKKLFDVQERYRIIMFDYGEKDFLKRMGTPNSELGESHKKATLAWEKVTKEVPPILDELGDEFRKIIGVKVEL